MRKMRKFLNILFLMAFALSFASCEGDDQYDVESIFIGRAWTGDVGMNADNGEPLFSTFTFWGDGFGEEYQSSNPQLSSSASFLRLNVLSSLN